MDALQWLDSDFMFAGEDGSKYRCKVVERLAELIMVNGGTMHVPGWGQVQVGQGIYGRIGLKMNEAIQLINMSGMLQGALMVHASEAIQKACELKVGREIERMKALESGFQGWELVEEATKGGGIEICSEDKLGKMLKLKKSVDGKLRNIE